MRGRNTENLWSGILAEPGKNKLPAYLYAAHARCPGEIRKRTGGSKLRLAVLFRRPGGASADFRSATSRRTGKQERTSSRT